MDCPLSFVLFARSDGKRPLFALLRGGDQFPHIVLELAVVGLRAVLQVDHHILDRVDVEAVRVLRHLQAPGRDHPCALEREVAVVEDEVQHEHAVVAVGVGSRNRDLLVGGLIRAHLARVGLCRADQVQEKAHRIGVRLQQHLVAQLDQRGMYSVNVIDLGVDRHSQGFDGAEVVPREVAIEQRLAQLELARTFGFQIGQRRGHGSLQGDLLLDLQPPAIPVEEGLIHAVQLQHQRLARQQPFLQAIPVAEADEAIIGAQLVLQRPLGRFGHVVGQPVGLEVEPGEPGSHPGIEVLAGELAAQESGDLAVLRDGLVVDHQFLPGVRQFGVRVIDLLLDLL